MTDDKAQEQFDAVEKRLSQLEDAGVQAKTKAADQQSALDIIRAEQGTLELALKKQAERRERVMYAGWFVAGLIAVATVVLWQLYQRDEDAAAAQREVLEQAGLMVGLLQTLPKCMPKQCGHTECAKGCTSLSTSQLEDFHVASLSLHAAHNKLIEPGDWHGAFESAGMTLETACSQSRNLDIQMRLLRERLKKAPTVDSKTLESAEKVDFVPAVQLRSNRLGWLRLCAMPRPAGCD